MPRRKSRQGEVKQNSKQNKSSICLYLAIRILYLIWSNLFVVSLHPFSYVLPMNQFPIIWLTGNSGAGKTTLAQGMRTYFNEQEGSHSAADRRVVVLDGDDMRETISRDEGFSPEDRRKHNLRVARLAKLMSDHGFLVIVAVIAPFEEVRKELDVVCSPLWIFVKRSGLDADDKPYEPPKNPDLVVDNNQLSIEEGKDLLQEFIVRKVGKSVMGVR